MQSDRQHSVGHVKEPADTIAILDQGSVAGRRTAQGFVFRGVPYAGHVSGRARFTPSRSCERSGGSSNAHERGVIAPQQRSRLADVMGEINATQGEDCLILTIWTPNLSTPDRPVVIWFHGGAYVSGAGDLDWYSGELLSARGDIVVVNVNHRLGVLGYLADPERPCSLAIEDQRLAIDWVRRNISAFGGDADSITLMGQSAGAISIAHLIQDTETARLIKRIILQSGGFGRAPLQPERAAEVRGVFLKILSEGENLKDETAILESASVERILSAQADTMAHFGGDLVFRPLSTESQTRAEFISATATAAAHSGISVMIGVTSEEGRAFTPVQSPTMAEVKRTLDKTGGEGAFEAYRSNFPAMSETDLQLSFMTDFIYRSGNLALAREISRLNGECYFYSFDWGAPASQYGACHCIELPFVFGTFDAWHDAGMLRGGVPSEMESLSSEVQGNWISFIRHGKPAESLWSKFEGSDPVLRRFDAGKQEVVPAYISDPGGN